MRKAFEDQNNSANGMLKAFKIGGWMFIGIGVMLCLTVIGIPVGLLLIGAGFLIMKELPSTTCSPKPLPSKPKFTSSTWPKPGPPRISRPSQPGQRT
jgi:hypothetical protein